jgi:hypothetical protein
LLKYVAVDAVAIAKEIRRCAVIGESLHDLLRGPVGGGMLGHVEVDDASAMVNQHDENEEDAQARRGDREEIEGDQIPDMVNEECSPGLRRPRTPLRHEPRDGALGHVDAELQEFAMDARRAPQGVRGGHTEDQSLDLSLNLRATSVRAAGELGPILAEATPLPMQNGGGVTITTACLHPVQILASPIQKKRSVGRNGGRMIVRL